MISLENEKLPDTTSINVSSGALQFTGEFNKLLH